ASVIAQLALLGVRVPDDIAVCGFDGVSIGALMVPPLSTVQQPSHEIGARACALLLARLAGQPAESVRLPHRIIDGGTAKALYRESASALLIRNISHAYRTDQ